MQWNYYNESVTIKCLECGLSLDYSFSIYYPHTSVKWSYDNGDRVPLDEVWNARKDGWND